MPIIYAAPPDLSAWLALSGAQMPEFPGGYLRTASMAVTEATETAFYATDSDGLPTETKTLQAFKDATCAQAAALIAFEIDPTAGGTLEAGGVETSVAIGSARITYADTIAAIEAIQQLLGGLTRDAALILRQAGIQLGIPWIVG
jgi:hypothetical protein